MFVYAIESQGGYNHKQDTPGDRIYLATTMKFDWQPILWADGKLGQLKASFSENSGTSTKGHK